MACGAAIVVLALGAMTARADERHGGARAEHRAEHFDERYSHNHYYPGRGGYVRAVPGRPFILERGGGRYFYSGGVWYAPYGPRFVVVGAPMGVFVPVLPPFYTTVWIGGFPYYYANETYYAWRDAENGYEVVEPPNDQGASCHKWASAQTGFDPTQSAGGVPPEQAGGKHADYQRAMRACLEGRGYSVR